MYTVCPDHTSYLKKDRGITKSPIFTATPSALSVEVNFKTYYLEPIILNFFIIYNMRCYTEIMSNRLFCFGHGDTFSFQGERRTRVTERKGNMKKVKTDIF